MATTCFAAWMQTNRIHVETTHCLFLPCLTTHNMPPSLAEYMAWLYLDNDIYGKERHQATSRTSATSKAGAAAAASFRSKQRASMVRSPDRSTIPPTNLHQSRTDTSSSSISASTPSNEHLSPRTDDEEHYSLSASNPHVLHRPSATEHASPPNKTPRATLLMQQLGKSTRPLTALGSSGFRQGPLTNQSSGRGRVDSSRSNNLTQPQVANTRPAVSLGSQTARPWEPSSETLSPTKTSCTQGLAGSGTSTLPAWSDVHDRASEHTGPYMRVCAAAEEAERLRVVRLNSNDRTNIGPPLQTQVTAAIKDQTCQPHIPVQREPHPVKANVGTGSASTDVACSTNVKERSDISELSGLGTSR